MILDQPSLSILNALATTTEPQKNLNEQSQ